MVANRGRPGGRERHAVRTEAEVIYPASQQEFVTGRNLREFINHIKGLNFNLGLLEAIEDFVFKGRSSCSIKMDLEWQDWSPIRKLL